MMEPKQARTLKAHGVRGSFPVSGPGFMEFGGNTSCYSIEYPDRILVFDAGTGIEQVKWSGKPIHVLLSHLHMDHVMGLFCWQALFCPEAEIHFYGEESADAALEQQLGRLFEGRFWPVKLSETSAKLFFHPFAPGNEIHFSTTGEADVCISALRAMHPDGCMLFHVKEGGHSLVYMLDYELGQADRAVRERLLTFIRNADYLLFDAQYSPRELSAHAGWGHSSWEQGLTLCAEAGIGHILLGHYDRSHDDACLAEEEKKAHTRNADSVFMREGREYLLWPCAGR